MWWNRVIRRLISSIPGTAGEQGDYTFLDVAPGAYQASVSFVGFTPSSQDVVVTAGQPTRMDVTLQASGRNEKVVVTAERPHGEAEEARLL